MENFSTTPNPDPTPSPTIGPILTRNALKAVLIIVLFFATFLAGTACFPLRKYVRAHVESAPVRRAFSLVSCFGAGVFLATCLLDLLPDSMDSVARAERRIGHAIAFPLPAFGISIGFLLVMLLEQAVLYASERGLIAHTHMLTGTASTSGSVAAEHQQPPPLDVDAQAGNGATSEDEQHMYGGELGEQHSTMRVYLLVFALSLHAVFEGLSVGMIDHPNAIIQIFFALLIHKSIVGFSLGVRLVQSRLRPVTIVLCCAIFAGQVLIGGFIGLAVMDFLAGKPSMLLVSGILQAIACGSFLYITAFEILPHELATHHGGYSNRPLKMLTLLAGFALIAAFCVLFPEPDEN